MGWVIPCSLIAAKAPIAERSFKATRVSTFPLTAKTYGQRAWRSPSDPWFLVRDDLIRPMPFDGILKSLNPRIC